MLDNYAVVLSPRSATDLFSRRRSGDFGPDYRHIYVRESKVQSNQRENERDERAFWSKETEFLVLRIEFGSQESETLPPPSKARHGSFIVTFI